MPRKRQKVSHSSSQSEGPSGIEDGSAPTHAGNAQENNTRSLGTDIKTAKRPVSPPLVRRLVNRTSTPSGARPRQGPLTKATNDIPSPSHTTKRRETLNPRLLSKPPAKHELRFKLLDMLHKELARLNSELRKDGNDAEQKLVLSDQELIDRALNEEEKTATQKASVYANIMKNMVLRHKKMPISDWKTLRVAEVDALRKSRSGKAESDEKPIIIETGLAPSEEIQLLSYVSTPVGQLTNHGYVASAPSEADIESARSGLEAAKGWEKCDRCQQRFQVFPGRREEDGILTSNGPCRHHWGKSYIPPKPAGSLERVPKRYRCCGEELGETAGCYTGRHHVYKVSDPKRLATIFNFVETPENPLVESGTAVCFDGEMGYTVHGMELVRLTATAWPTGEELLDVLVRPFGEILDLNSRYSGVWPDDLAKARPLLPEEPLPKLSVPAADQKDGLALKKTLRIVASPEEARTRLLSLLTPTTPLIGHGLENDLNATRIIHPTIIDSVLLYPHRMGLPYRHGLKMLMERHLNRKIQQDETDSPDGQVAGHDSAEDARAAGDLVRLKVMGQWTAMRHRGWKFADGELVAPDAEKRSK